MSESNNVLAILSFQSEWFLEFTTGIDYQSSFLNRKIKLDSINGLSLHQYFVDKFDMIIEIYVNFSLIVIRVKHINSLSY